MELSKEQIKEALKELEAKPIYEGSNIYLLFGETIDTGKIKNLKQLIQYVFACGQDCKIKEVKNVLNIGDPRI
jgi:hypothetical protein